MMEVDEQHRDKEALCREMQNLYQVVWYLLITLNRS